MDLSSKICIVFEFIGENCYNQSERRSGIFMDHVVLEIDLHLINNIRVIYYVVSNSVEQRVLTNKINGILAKKDVHRFNNCEGSYYSIPVFRGLGKSRYREIRYRV